MDDVDSVAEKLPLLQFLPGETRQLVLDSFVPVSFSFGQPIVREGDEADAFFVLLSGQARVVKNSESGEEVSLNSIRPGDSFGEMGLLEDTARAATVRASTDVEALKLDRSVFRALLNTHPEIRQYFELQTKHRNLHNFFRLYSPFVELPVAALGIMLEELEPVSIQKGDMVIEQGTEPGPMYVVEEGRLRVFVATEEGQRKYLAYLRKGDFFGELSLFKGIPRTASVEAVSPCNLLMLRAETFQRLCREYPEFRKRIEERIAQYDYKGVAHVPLDFADELLPAELAVHEKVGPRQVDHMEESVETAGVLGPFASGDGRFVKQGRRIWRFPFVHQIDEMDCGAACLAMVCRYFGRAVPLGRIRQLVHTSLDGTSLKALCHAATELGLAARSVKASVRNLDQLPVPAIVHWAGNHWVVLYHLDRQRAFVADPAIGLRRLPREEFEKQWSGYTALFDYTEAFADAPQKGASRAWLWPLFRPFSGAILQALALAMVSSGLQMVLPVATQVIVDTVLVEQDVGLLHVVILAMLGVLVLMTTSMIVQRYLLSFAAVRIDAAALDFLTRKLLALPMTYFNSRRTGDIQRRLEGIKDVRDFIVQQGVGGLTSAVQLAVVLLVMFIYSAPLAFIFLATAPLYALLMHFSAHWLRPVFDNIEESLGKYSSYQIDAIKGIETVKAMGAEGVFREMMLNQFHGIARRVFRADFTVMCYEGGTQMVTFLSLILFLWIGASQVMQGQMTIGALVAFNALVTLGNASVLTLLSLWDNLQQSSVLVNRLNDVLEHEPEQGTDHSQLLAVKTLEGRVRFQGMGFQYGGPEAPKILDGIHLDVPPGTMVAIVGRSGSGKTTLIKCLAGLLEPSEGTVYFDGIDMRTLNYRDLRQKIGFVLQENHLFDDTIARNIAFGTEEPDMNRVLWAARMANAHEFIDRFPLGYDTRVGESGVSLSGGQRQRVAIARALYHRPPVLIFDEATSSLDTESERAIQENMSKLLGGRTSFVIAHRLSTIRDADVIVVLEKGKLVERGNHDELMARQGLYFYLCSQQLGL